jgi:preprotein translocase subunit SecG
MTILITVIILLACVVLGFFVLIQAPKGGGLTGAFGSMSSQVMGVKQSSDVMEKGTWTTIGVISLLCIVLTIFYPAVPKNQNEAAAPAQKQQPKQGSNPAPATPAPQK